MTKVCSKCGEEKDYSSFYKDKRTRSGCKAECIDCTKKYYREHRNRLLLKQKASYAQRPGELWSVQRKAQLKYLYGISMEDYMAMFHRQKGLCAICHSPETSRDWRGATLSLAVDHDHVTGHVRGLLCREHNLLVGQIEKSSLVMPFVLGYINAHP